MSQQQDRTAVRTYVPENQSEVWADEADSLDMSLSEFVRSMVQAGRRGFDLGSSEGGVTSNPEEVRVPGANPGGQTLEDRVLSALDSGEVANWEELVDALSEDFESELEAALDVLMDEGAIKLDHRRGGYRLREE